MLVKTFPVGIFQCNCVILGDKNTGEAIVIDPGDEEDRIIKELKKDSLTVKYILHTHAHIDHIGSTGKLKKNTKGDILLHKDDLFLYDNIAMQGQTLGIPTDSDVSPVDHLIAHGDSVEWGKAHLSVIHTPGHTPGSLSFLIKNMIGDKDVLLTGDTLFQESIGRTDLWGGDFKQLIHSIKTRLLKYDDDTLVIPGHGPSTTIGDERSMNPFLQD